MALSVGPPITKPFKSRVPKPPPPPPAIQVSLGLESKAEQLRRILRARIEKLLLVKILDIPEQFDRAHLKRVLEDMGDQIVRDLAAQTTQAIEREAGERQRQIDEAFKKQDVPPAEEAIELGFAPSETLDIWHTETLGGASRRGPRRVWKNTLVQRPSQGLEKSDGPFRYRLRLDEVRLGVMSVRYLDKLANFLLTDGSQSGSRLEVTYGILLKGIPWYGTKLPRKITLAEYAGMPPSSLVGNVPGVATWLTGAQQLGEAKAADSFDTQAPVYFEAFKDTSLAVAGSNWFAPDKVTTSYVDEIEGLTLMLLTGDTGDEVYAQMNSLPSVNLSQIGGNAKGPTASVPDGLEVTSPCVASLAGVNVAGTQLSTAQIESFASATNKLLSEGAPFRHTDCDSLRRSEDRFSMVLRVWPPRILQWDDIDGMLSDPSLDQNPAAWHTSGVKFVKQNDRNTTVDVVVE